MRKRKWVTFLMLLALFVCAACNGSDVPEETEGIPTESETVSKDEGTAEPMQESHTEEDKPSAEEKELVIYYSNKNADGLETEMIAVPDITPEVIISNLAKHNIVSIDTKVNEFAVNKEEERGRTIIVLDMSKAFGEYIRTMGSSGESVIIAALTDTFLTAYEADALKLSVEGSVLETGHRIYEEELTYMDINLNEADE